MSVIDKLFKRKSDKDNYCSAVIVAAGSAQRMGSDKILMDIGGAPVIAHTLKAFQKSELINEIVVVTRTESLQEIADICIKYGIKKISKVIEGGKTRAESALIGVYSVSENASLIAIHDGARPLITEKLIERVVSCARDSHAAAPAVSATDTVRLINDKGIVTSTPDRDSVAMIQTPQVFTSELIKAALYKVVEKNLKITDDCSAVEALGYKITVVAGEADNIKLTSPKDVYSAEHILADRREKE